MENKSSGEPEDYFLTDEEEAVQEQAERLKSEQDALNNPALDYWKLIPPTHPKKDIGEYVSSQGFNVPLIRSPAEWESAFDEDRAMIRSEMRQDYDGLSGLLTSVVIDRKSLEYPLNNYAVDAKFNRKIGKIIISGLRSGELSAEAYMSQFEWPKHEVDMLREANRQRLQLHLQYPRASLWRYESGTNIRVFRDPNVDGRYHLGIKPDNGYVMGYMIEKDQHNEIINQESGTREVPVSQVIEHYEAVRALPRFDNTQAPLLELKLDEGGQLHFLQYLKTGQKMNPTDEFELPGGEGVITSNYVRGVTAPEGKETRLYMAPKKITKRMQGQGFYFDILRPDYLAQQYLSMIGSVIIHYSGVSLKNNHNSTAPLIRPEVCVGLGEHYKSPVGDKLRELTAMVHGHTIYDKVPDRNVYLNTKITSNGRQATIETDWEPHF